MKKGFKAVTAAALAISALTPVAAFAAENTVENGVYTTTNFYSLDAFKKLSGSAKAAALTSEGAVIVVAGKVYTGANVISLNDTQLDASAVTVDAYNAANDNKLVSGQPIGGGNQTGELKVASVSAINAKEIKVTFSNAVDKATVLETAGTLKAGVFVFTTLDNKTITADSAKGVLSEDGKTLTITAQTTEVFEGRYDVTIDGAKDKAGKAVEKYEVKNLTFAKDTVAPTVTTERVSSNKVKVKFSEPVVFSAGALTAKYADSAVSPALAPADITVGGTNLTSLAAASGASVSEITLDLNTNVKENKDIVVTLNGVADTVGNLLNPQPATVTISKLTVDGIEPTIATVAQTGAKTFSIKFNKDLDGTTLAFGDVTVGGTPATAIKKVSASEYEFTMAANLKGLQTVTVAAGKAKDLAGQTNTNALSKVVTFTEDTVAPKATAKLTTDKNNKQVIELTFDKDVTAGNVTVAGKQVKDYVTTAGISESVTAVYADANNKKVLHVPLSANALAVEGAEYDVTISSTAIKSDAGKDMDDVKIKFTRGKDGQPENVNSHVVSNVVVAQGANANTVTATFTIPNGTSLDGASATNLDNYVIAGAVVESISLAAANGTTQVATLTLKEDSNTFTGVRNITVKNVKVAGSTKVMEPKTIVNVSLNENVRPTLTKSEVTDITLGSAGSSVVNATTSNVTFTEAAVGGASAGTVAVAAGYNAGTTDKAAIANVEFEYNGSAWVSNTTGVNASDVTINVTTGTVATGDKVKFDLSAYTAAVAPTTASTDVKLTFSEAVTKAGAAVDFDLLIGGEKVTGATVATTAASNTTTLTVKIDKALTAEDFAKGVQLKAVSTLDIKDQVGNLLKLDGPINLVLN